MVENIKKGDKIINKIDLSEKIVDCVDVYDEVTLIFTEDKKYIKIDDCIIIPQDTDICRVWADNAFGSTIEERDRTLMEWAKSFEDTSSNKKTTKEYLLSPLLNLFPKAFRLWT